jgi:hypothetical protein
MQIRDGWKLQAGVAATVTAKSGTLFLMQAMIKDESAEN